MEKTAFLKSLKCDFLIQFEEEWLADKTRTENNWEMDHGLVNGDRKQSDIIYQKTESSFDCRQCAPENSSEKLDIKHLKYYGKIHMESNSREKKYQSNECGGLWASMALLQNHMMTHTNEKPHSCSVCDKSFWRLDTLNGHMRTHTREKPHKFCDCGKSFTESRPLQAHQRVHTGERPLACICKQTTQESTLDSHIRGNRGDKPHAKRVHTKETPSRCCDVFWFWCILSDVMYSNIFNKAPNCTWIIDCLLCVYLLCSQ